MNEPRGNLYLLTGLGVGLALGLLISLVFSPVRYRNVAPSALNSIAKDDYRRAIALAYAADQNLARASERLAVLDGSNAAYLLAAQAQNMLAGGGAPQEARALAILAADLSNPAAGAATGAPGLRTATPVLPSQTGNGAALVETAAVTGSTLLPGTPLASTPIPAGQTLEPTFTALPSATPPSAQGAPFVLQASEEVCSGTITPGLLQVFVYDAQGRPLAGVAVTVTWQAGEETFYTGLAPEISPGYTDYAMQPGESYTLTLGPASQPLEGLAVPGCGGGWRVEYRAGQP